MAKTIRELSEQLASFERKVLASQEKMGEEIKEIKEKLTSLSEEMSSIKQTAVSAKEQAEKNTQRLNHLTSQLNDLSDRNRRANLILAGITEDVGFKSLEESLRVWIEENGVKINPEDIERAHRLQRRGGGETPRDVIIKFSREKLQQQVYKTLKKKPDLNFRGRKVWIREDFCQATIMKKKEMRPFGQRLYDNNVKFSWGYPSSIIVFKEGKRHIARNPKEAVELLKRLGINTDDFRDQDMEEEIEATEDPGEGGSGRGEKRPRTESLVGTT